jgi:uncharacterized protein
MPTRDTPFAPGTPCWVELLSSDVAASQAFYGGLFDWTFEQSGADFGGYVTAYSDAYRVAGIVPHSAQTPGPDAWTTYIAATDAQAAVAAVADAGGQVIAPAMAVGDLGALAIVSDPTAAIFGIWQAGTHTGFGRYNEPGSVTWDEHHSRDFATSTRFYERVFGWTMDKSAGDTDEFRYYAGEVDGAAVAGLSDSARQLPEQAPSFWTVYFAVEDADEASGRVGELGGTVTMPAQDTPYGRIAEVHDNAGVQFMLHSEKLAGPAG